MISMRKLPTIISVALTCLLGSVLFQAAFAAESITRTPWQQHNGYETVGFTFTCTPVVHGDICEFNDAVIPDFDDPNWISAPDPDTIGFSPGSALSVCWTGDFTYFQTFVEVPEGFEVEEFTIQFNGMDDGAVVSICDAVTQVCSVVAGSHVTLGNGGTSDLSELVSEGINRVVITQVDDCPTGNNLVSAIVKLNGEPVVVPPPPPTDDDGDGVDNDHDLCPATTAGAIVNANGCSGAQAISLVCPTTDEYKNHGQYVSCVSHAVEDAVLDGLITEEEGEEIVSSAAQSDVGKKAKPAKAGKK